MQLHRSSRHVGSLFVAGFLVACGGDTTEPDPLVLALVSGSGQTATQGLPVSNPLVVSLTQGGNGVSGSTVSWTVTAGGGT